MKPLERLRDRHAVTAVDIDGATAFTRDAAPGVLLLPGDPTRPELTDVAVVLGELATRFPRFRLGIAPEGDAAAMRVRFGVTAFPALLFVRGGEVVTAIARMQAWSAYERAARALEVQR